MDNPHIPSFDHPRRRPRDSRKIPPRSRALPALDRLLRARVTARPSLDRRRAAVVMFHAGNPPPAPEGGRGGGAARKRRRSGRGNGGAPRPRDEGDRARPIGERLEFTDGRDDRRAPAPPRPNLMKNTGGALARAQRVEAQTGNAPSSTAAFENMGLTEASSRAIRDVLRFTHATAVQDATLPHIMAGLDVLARAKTGSGKTVGFCFPRSSDWRGVDVRDAERCRVWSSHRRASWRRKSAKRRRAY